MFKSLVTKLKDTFQNTRAPAPEPEPQPQVSAIPLIGHVPFTRKFLQTDIPLLIADFQDNPYQLGALCEYDVFSNVVKAVYLDQSDPDAWSNRLEHECVHVDQLQNCDKKPSIFYDPMGFVAEGRFLELEAYTREAYSVLFNYRSGHIEQHQSEILRNYHIPMSYLVCLATNTQSLHSLEDYWHALDNVRTQDAFPDEERLISNAMLQLSMNDICMTAITESIISHLQIINNATQLYTATAAQKGAAKATDELGFNVTPQFFSQTFTTDDIYPIAQRGDCALFKHIPDHHMPIFTEALYKLTGQQEQQIKQASTHMRPYR